MKMNWKKALIGSVASAMLVSGAGAAAFAANGADDVAKPGTRITSTGDRRQAEVRHEAEARGRIAEGEREAGDDHGREAAQRGRENEAEHENEAGNDDGRGHDRGDDRGGDR
jgi:hypothetical protein